MPEAVPNYLSTKSDGTVSANFPGGVTVLEDPNPAGNVNSMADGHGVTWYRGPGGAIVAQIAANMQATAPTSSQLKVQSRSPDQAGFAGFAMQAFNGGAATIQTILPFDSETLLDSNGSSHWAQLVGTGNVRFQVINQLFAATAGWNTYTFNWPIAFITAGSFVFSIRISSGATITGQEANGMTTNQVSVNVSSAIAQTCAIQALGWGT